MPALLLFLWIAGFIGFYWLLRIVVDFAGYSHRDWPGGELLVIGHVFADIIVCISVEQLSACAVVPLVKSISVLGG